MRKPYITPVSSCTTINVQTAFLAGSGEPAISIDKDIEIEENLSRKFYSVWDEEDEEF